MHLYVLSTLAFLGLVTTTSLVMAEVSEGTPPLAVPVQGLDAERAPTIERGLRALESEGEPPHVKLLSEVAVDIEAGTLALVIAPGQTLHLKQVERVLSASEVRLKGDRFALGASTLVYEGNVGEGAAEKLRSALTSDLFAEAEVRRAEDPARLVAKVTPGEDPATYDSAAKAGRSVAATLRLADVVWTRPKER